MRSHLLLVLLCTAALVAFLGGQGGAAPQEPPAAPAPAPAFGGGDYMAQILGVNVTVNF